MSSAKDYYFYSFFFTKNWKVEEEDPGVYCFLVKQFELLSPLSLLEVLKGVSIYQTLISSSSKFLLNKSLLMALYYVPSLYLRAN